MNNKTRKKNVSRKKKKKDDINLKRILVVLNFIIIFLIIEQIIMFSLLLKRDEKVTFIEPLSKIDVKNINNIYNANEKFIFDGLEINIGDTISFLRIDNEYSNYNNRLVVKVPITIKNNHDEKYSLNIYDYSIYGPLKNELDEVAGYFKESLFYANDLNPLESYTKYLYFLYDSNGQYIIDFNKNSERVKVVLNVERKSGLKTKEETYFNNKYYKNIV